MPDVDGDKLKELRENKVLTMRQVSDLAGVSFDTIWRLENNRTGGRQSSITKLARVFQVEPKELLRKNES